MYRCLFLFILLASCRSIAPLQISQGTTGSSFYQETAAMQWKQRETIALQLLSAGNIPAFLNHFVPIRVEIIDAKGKKIKAVYYVMPDYLSIGTNTDWARIPLTPQTAQKVADQYQCFLPTRKMVNDIYQQAKIKLDPLPMFAFRDSTVTMWQHHLMIEGQRKGRAGLIAGIKKDVVISAALKGYEKNDRVAIYGWHRLNGQAIQPLYTKHVNWYVDYSHGIRLVYQTIWVNGKPMNYQDVLSNPVLKGLLCDEDDCSYYRY